MRACYTLYAFRSIEEALPEIAASECFHHPFTQYAMDMRGPKVASKTWIEV